MGTGSPLPTVPAHRPSDYVASHASKAGLDDDINKGAPSISGDPYVAEKDSEEARLLELSKDLARTLSQKYLAWKADKATKTPENDPPTRYLSELDEDEWEECEPGEDGCEAFIVDTEPAGGASTQTASHVSDEGEEDADVKEAKSATLPRQPSWCFE